MPRCDADSNLRKNLIVDNNVQRTNDVNMTSDMTISPLMYTINSSDRRPVTPGCCNAEVRALTQPGSHFEVCRDLL